MTALPCPDCGYCPDCGTSWCGGSGCPVCPCAAESPFGGTCVLPSGHDDYHETAGATVIWGGGTQ